MRRRSFLKLAGAAGGAYGADRYLRLIPAAQAAIPGTVTWGGAYLLDEATADMPHTKAALAMNASSSPTGQSVNSALLEAIREADWSMAGIDLRAGLKKQETRYGMVFGLARESVLQSGYRPSEDKTAFTLRLIGYNTIYDIQDRRIISTFAVRGRYFTALAGDVGEDALPNLYFDLLANRDNSGSVARFMTELALDYEYDIKYRGKNFRYIETIMTPFAAMGADLIDLDPDRHDEEIGFMASTAFSEKLKVPIVPYRKTTAVNRRMLREMKIATISGDSPLNTALPLSPAQIGIRVIDHGWEFKEKEIELRKTSKRGAGEFVNQDFFQLQVSLGARLEVQFFEIETNRMIFAQQFGGQWTFIEYADKEFQMSRKNRLYLLHETITDRAFGSIKDVEMRGQLYDGLDIEIRNDRGDLIETYYLEALSDDWDVLSAECASVESYLPRAFGT